LEPKNIKPPFALVFEQRRNPMNRSSTDLSVEETQRGVSTRPHVVVHPEELTPHFPINRRAWIARTAYAMAQRRGFEPGHELEDWLEAEKQVLYEIVGEGRTF
jgi:Protein of unknown function (DUF2934)